MIIQLREQQKINYLSIDADDRELVMRLEPIYQRDREQAIWEGNKQGEERLVLRQLNRRLGEINQSLIESIQQLSIEQLENLGEALLDFSNIADLETWLNQQQE